MSNFPFRLYGGATRPDAISNLNPAFSQALLGLYQSAPPEVQAELGLNSAYRSPAVQQVLWDKSDKTGRTVAAPGKSKHQHGTAADLYGFGLGGNSSVSQGTRDWINANAEAHGLYFPMSYEPWHIQLRGDGSVATAASATPSAPLPGPSLPPDPGASLADTLASASAPRRKPQPQLVEDEPEVPAPLLEFQTVGGLGDMFARSSRRA